MTHGSVAASVRTNKENHPGRYCPARGCLWSLRGGKACPKHPVAAMAPTPLTAAELEYKKELEAQPRYHDGTVRPQWSGLSAIARWQRVRIAGGEATND